MKKCIDASQAKEILSVQDLIVKYLAGDIKKIIHAKWKNNLGDYPECTNCGYMPMYDPHLDDIYYSPYCPNCGATMSIKE